MEFEEYRRGYNIGALRKMLFELGGTPGSKSKDELIEEIIGIKRGEIVPVRSGRGRPSLSGENDVRFSDYDEVERVVGGVLEFVPEGYGFLRAENCDNSTKDAFIAKQTIKNYYLREGEYVVGRVERKQENKLPEVVEVYSVNGKSAEKDKVKFDAMTPRYPDRKLSLGNTDLSLRVVDLFAPIGYGQRGLIVAPPKTGKTTLLKNLALAIEKNRENVKLLVFLVDERPEEVTDFKEGLEAEVIYSTFDSSPEHHVRIAELLMKRMRSLVESGYDVVVLMDSITKLVRAYNSIVPASGKILSGGIDPQALVLPKKFFGLARNTDCGSLTIIATALVETGSRMDDVVFEEFKGTGNMEIVLSRQLAERRIFPAIDIRRSGTRREETLLTKSELECSYKLRRVLDENVGTDSLLEMMARTKSNDELAQKIDEWLKYLKG